MRPYPEQAVPGRRVPSERPRASTPTLAPSGSALALMALWATTRALSRLVLPSLTPRALAAASATLVRAEIIAGYFYRRRMNGSVSAPDERHAPRHQAGGEDHVAAQPIELGDNDRAVEALGLGQGGASCGRRPRAPLRVSISTSSAKKIAGIDY